VTVRVSRFLRRVVGARPAATPASFVRRHATSRPGARAMGDGQRDGNRLLRIAGLTSILSMVCCSGKEPDPRPEPPPTYGDSCTENAQCDAPLECVAPVLFNTKCTYECDSARDCPEGSYCLTDAEEPTSWCMEE